MSTFEDFLPRSANGQFTRETLPKSSKGYAIEEKYDGSLYVARFSSLPSLEKPLAGRGDIEVRFTSRRLSVKSGQPCDKTANLPHIHAGPKSLAGTLLLGEITGGERFNDTAGIMNSLPEKAIAEQKRSGWLRYIVFDCLWFKGADLRGGRWVFSDRRLYAERAVTMWTDWLSHENRDGYAAVSLSPVLNTSDRAAPVLLYDLVIRKGGEGLMLKSWNTAYGKGVYKCKKAVTVEVSITGFTLGKGKYEGQIGAIKFSVYDPLGLRLIEVGQCSGMDDATRSMLSTNPGKSRYLNTVFEVECQPPDNPKTFYPGEDRLRHPRFVRFRPDLNYKQATDKKLIQDFQRVVR